MSYSDCRSRPTLFLPITMRQRWLFNGCAHSRGYASRKISRWWGLMISMLRPGHIHHSLLLRLINNNWGREALRLLLEENQEENLLLPVQLVVRASSGK